MAHCRDAVRVRQLCLGALSLGQVDDEGDALVPEFAEGRRTHKHRHAAAVFPKILLLEGFAGSGRSQLRQGPFVGSGPFGRCQGGPAQAARNDIIAAISHDAEKRVVGLHDATVKIENAYPDDIGVDEASNLRLPFLEIAIETRVLQRDRGLRRQKFKEPRDRSGVKTCDVSAFSRKRIPINSLLLDEWKAKDRLRFVDDADSRSAENRFGLEASSRITLSCVLMT